MIVNNIQDLISLLRSKPGYFDNTLDKFYTQVSLARIREDKLNDLGI